MLPTKHATRRLVSLALVSCALLSLLTTTAHAEPSTVERRQVAEDVATTTCAHVPEIPALPPSINPAKLCRTVIVENIDPEGNNAGVAAACTAALPLAAKAAARYCAQVIDKLLDPARKVFLDKVVPVAQQLACMASSPGSFDCLAQQVHVWLNQSIVSLWQGLLTATTAETTAIDLLDGWRNPGLVSLYSDIGALGAILLLGAVLASLLVSLLLFDFRRFGNVFLGIIVWGVFWSGGVAIAVLLLKASDVAAVWVAGRPDANGETDLTRAGKEFTRWIDYISAATPTLPGGGHPVFNPGSLTALLICVLLIVAIIVAVVALLMRNVALLLLVMLLPLTLAGTAGPKLTRTWFHSAVRLFIAFLLAKPLIVIALRLGAVLVSVPQAGEPQATFTDALLGVSIILIAGLLPGVIYRFSGGLMQTAAGNPPRASGGMTAQSAQSVQSTMDLTRMIMARNAPLPLFAGSGGAARTTGTAAAASRGLGAAAAAPLGLVAMAGAMAGSGLESAGRWMGGQAATGGGVVGDVEAPHVPLPPISRAAHLGPRRPKTTGAGPEAGSSPMPATLYTVTQTHPGDRPGPPLPPPSAPVVIPGSTVPDKAPELPASPKALPAGESHE